MPIRSSADCCFAGESWGQIGNPVAGASGLSIAVDASMEEFSNGIDDWKTSQLAIVAGEPVEKQLTPQLNAFLRGVARRGLPISGVGTAPWLLAQTGLLADTRCTIHWSRLAAFSGICNPGSWSSIRISTESAVPRIPTKIEKIR